MTTAKLELAGQAHEFKVRSGIVGPNVIDISSLYSTHGAFTYDTGLHLDGKL